ncbi:hypothetical protein J6590_041245 [Homalodisca vitripennis]|nr:hypothetical protein J6590_041245 [Homalodisca vitripennis]
MSHTELCYANNDVYQVASLIITPGNSRHYLAATLHSNLPALTVAAIEGGCGLGKGEQIKHCWENQVRVTALTQAFRLVQTSNDQTYSPDKEQNLSLCQPNEASNVQSMSRLKKEDGHEKKKSYLYFLKHKIKSHKQETHNEDFNHFRQATVELITPNSL